MKILAVDTSSSNCAIAIVDAQENKFNILCEKNSDDEKSHSQKLMPLISESFSDSNLYLSDIDLIACSIGPGSFTGIRIEIATCKAFVDSKKIPATGVSSLESLAYNVSENGYIISLIDCKNNNVYASLYYKNENSYTKVTDFLADSIDNVLSSFKNFISSDNKSSHITFVGNASLLYNDLIISYFSSFDIAFCKENTQSAVSLAKCGYNNFLNHNIGDSSALSPLYLRASQAEQNFKK